MPIISQFYGIIIKMFFKDNVQHNLPHLHAEYAEYSATIDLDGNLIEGNLPNKQQKMVDAWIAIHHDELIAIWKILQSDGEYFKIDPLK
ncbi:MAG: DUF4160 domain-containing protein [Oscillospiraceae bacterium]|nr:DUF4160 domain-containing protein [Oscillospiraceae bacterium]